MAGGGRQDADAALVERVVEAGLDHTGDRESVDELGVGGLNQYGAEEEVSGLESGSGDDDRVHREDLLLFQGWRKPNGDRCHGRHDCIAEGSYASLLQSICLRMNVGISMSLRSCSGDDRSRSGVTIGLLVGVFLFGSSSGVLVRPFPRAGRSGITGAPRMIGDGVATTGWAWLEAVWGRSKPVAITVTLISPCMAGSWTAPKMISASSPTASWMISLIWWTSPRVRSAPPVILTRTPVAPETDTLSSSGLAIACWAASMERFSPRPMPVPMS